LRAKRPASICSIIAFLHLTSNDISALTLEITLIGILLGFPNMLNSCMKVEAIASPCGAQYFPFKKSRVYKTKRN